MPVISAKRQVTLPIDQCRVAGLKAGDEYESYVDREGIIMIMKKQRGAAQGILKHVVNTKRFRKDISDEQSISDSIDTKFKAIEKQHNDRD